MPAILTHDFFGRETVDRAPELAGDSTDELDAFLLGNQGPDPLFFCVLDPVCVKQHALGTTMHKDRTSELIVALKDSLDIIFDEEDKKLARAYAHGFIGHYSLDALVHPLVYAQQYALCDAGVDGLTRSSGHEVHAAIESELDEVMLYTRRHETIRAYKPVEHTLLANDHTLKVVSLMYSYMALAVYGKTVPGDLFTRSVRAYRTCLRLMYSPNGGKRVVVSNIERLVREHSFYNAISHEAIEREQSVFENREHNTWKNPYTGATSNASFPDLVERAQTATLARIAAFDRPDFGDAAAHAFTQDIDFDGKPNKALLLSVEDAE